MSIPAETEQIFREHAEAAVDSFRAALRTEPAAKNFLAAFDKVLLPSMKHLFVHLATTEFERVGKEHIRQVVLGVFDRFMEQPK